MEYLTSSECATSGRYLVGGWQSIVRMGALKEQKCG